MFQFVLRKMLNNKWMIACLLIGNILLCAVVSCVPLYSDAILQRVMTKELESIQTTRNVYPGVVNTELYISNANVFDLSEQVMNLSDQMVDSYGVDVLAKCVMRYSKSYRFDSVLERDTLLNNRSIAFRSYSDIEDHVNIISGRMFDPSPKDGVIEAIVSEATMSSCDLIVGEECQFQRLNDPSGNMVKFRVVGVFRAASDEDLFWPSAPGSKANSGYAIVSEEAFQSVFGVTYTDKYKSYIYSHYALDYTQLDVQKISQYVENTEKYERQLTDVYHVDTNNTFIKTLTNYISQAKQLNITLWLLLIPIFVLMAFFIFMVSRMILEQEKNTIAVIKSRGSSRAQVIGIFAIQSFLISLFCAVVGLPVGILICKVMGAANGFLNLVQRSALQVRLVPNAIWFTLAAALLSMLTMILPALRYSKATIVDHKRMTNAKGDKLLWKLILGAVMLGIGLYGYYTFRVQIDSIIQSDGQATIEPLLYLSSSLFIIGAGFVAALLLPLLIRLIFRLGRRFWSPALFASFLKVTRSAGDQTFIMVFLVLTLAIGVFNSTTARTINQNIEDNLNYSVGANIVMQQAWSDNSGDENAAQRLYIEPDFHVYERFDAENDDVQLTKVLNRYLYKINIAGTRGRGLYTRVMGINTDEFGRIAWMRDDLLPIHWYNYLNELSSDPTAVLVSENYKELGYELGGTIRINNENGVTFTGTIYGFFDYWPTYYDRVIRETVNGQYTSDMYLMVGNLSQMQTVWGIEPYQIWVHTTDRSKVYDFAQKNGLTYATFQDSVTELVQEKNSPILQGTNGVLTVGFVIVLLVCMTGFMIFWILSIRSRTLQFGIFRAMGMPMRDVFSMLINEQVLISLLSAAMGVGVGWIASRLYVPLIQMSYTTQDVSLPLRIVAEGSDYNRLFIVVGVLFVACILVLGIIIRKIRIAQALKLGED